MLVSDNLYGKTVALCWWLNKPAPYDDKDFNFNGQVLILKIQFTSFVAYLKSLYIYELNKYM